MKLAIATILGVLLVSTGTPAAGQDPEPSVAAADVSAEAAPPQVAQEEPRLICRREKTIGSNRATRVCRSPEQLREQQRDAQDALSRNRAVSSRRGD
ncbi:MAG: hypothetical protein ACTIJY_08035 [Luteimonas sp.]